MGMMEFDDGHLGEIIPIPSPEAMTKFQALAAEATEKVKRLHFGQIDELERYKDLREAQLRIEDKLDMIINHFNIVPIIGGHLQ